MGAESRLKPPVVKRPCPQIPVVSSPNPPKPPVVKSPYHQRVCQNLLPLSKAPTLPEALKEWFFNEKVIDHQDTPATCKLCDKRGLRYHFQIQNDHTQETLWVGSKCILQFDISVFDGGLLLDADRARHKLTSLMTKMRYNSCVKALERVADREDSDILFNTLKHYRQHGYLTPKQAFVVFWRLKKHGIDHTPKFFKVSLTRSGYKRDLREMPSDRVNMFWTALSPNQRRLAARLGHSGPTGTGGST